MIAAKRNCISNIPHRARPEANAEAAQRTLYLLAGKPGVWACQASG